MAPSTLAQLIKDMPLCVTGMSGIERAISSAGGIKATEIDAHMMLRKHPGLFVAGDVRTQAARQLVSACGDGATAALAAEKWLAAKE